MHLFAILIVFVKIQNSSTIRERVLKDKKENFQIIINDSIFDHVKLGKGKILG